MWKRALLLFILTCVAGGVLAGQGPPNEQTTTIRTTSREVILDVIVRDKHHHAVADLRPDEIEVFEDGVKQKLNAFRDVQGAEQLQREQALAKSNSATPSPGAANTAETPKTPTSLRELNFVSVVFAQIAPLNLEFARQAVQEFLKSDTLPNTYVTVYRLDRSLDLIQAYTADKTSQLKAVNAAAKGVNTGSGSGDSVAVASGINATVQANGTNMLATRY